MQPLDYLFEAVVLVCLIYQSKGLYIKYFYTDRSDTLTGEDLVNRYLHLKTLVKKDL